ncbi:MAG: YoaK family protein [Methylophilaceae bacterium]
MMVKIATTSPLSENSMSVAALLTLSGGFLDAFTYVGHGNVFANAMSGNIVLLGVYTAEADWAQAFRHIPPIIAFIIGVFIAHCMRLPQFKKYFANPPLTCLGLEIIFLLMGAFLPDTFPSNWLVPGIAFVAAMQNSSFTHIESLPYNSVMTTGNLRRSIEALFKGTVGPRNPLAFREAKLFGLICLCFLLGALIGAFATIRLHNAALFIPVCILVAALLLLWPNRKAA